MNFRIRYNSFEKNRYHEFQIWFFFCFLIWKKECRLSRCVSINICKSIAQIEIYSQYTKKPFSQNFKISCNDFESENKKCSFCLCNFLLQIIEKFVIQVLFDFVLTNSITWNDDFWYLLFSIEFVISNYKLITFN